MGTKVQSLLGYYSLRDLNEESSKCGWPLFYRDKSLANGKYYHNHLSGTAADACSVYDKDVVKQMMLEHDKSFTELLELLKDMLPEGNTLLELAIWCTYLHRECIAGEISDMYGFLDPYKICGSYGYKQETVQTYIQNKLIDQNKTCFLAPYLFGKHWQLFVVCPSVNTVVWMCSLHCLPNETLVEIVDKAMDGYNRMKGLRKTKPHSVTHKGPKQNDSYSCDHYVMINMMTTVSATITNNWKKMFNSSCPFTHEELTHVRQVWAEFFIKLYAERKPTSKEERRKQLK